MTATVTDEVGGTTAATFFFPRQGADMAEGSVSN